MPKQRQTLGRSLCAAQICPRRPNAKRETEEAIRARTSQVRYLWKTHQTIVVETEKARCHVRLVPQEFPWPILDHYDFWASFVLGLSKRDNGDVHRAAARIMQAEKAARPAAPCATYCYHADEAL